ncbi:MAG: hypothetical protein B7Z55_03090 [Planctomycetales bacterium 12-60-4]|nr:MAG: hypothetical protein B7Z55_03090 [Planctomycetales bacterium 12-60-4]
MPVDQALGLRTLLEERSRTGAGYGRRTPSSCLTLAITSGKGGVGKSVLAVNLSVALARQGLRVCLLDGNLGVGNVDLLCGLNGYWNLSHVVTGARRMADVCMEGPAGVRVVPGASGIVDIADCPPTAQSQLLQQFQQLEDDHDVLLIDTGSGIHRLVRQFALAAERVLIVTTPEPTSIADAYATIKAVHSPAGPQLSVVVNQATDDQTERIVERIQATARTFLRTGLSLGVGIPYDAVVPQSVLARRPFVDAAPSSRATRSVQRLAEKLAGQPRTPSRQGFFARLWPKMEQRVA